MTLKAISTGLSTQVLIAGQIRDGLTGRSPASAASVSVTFRRNGEESFRPFPAPLRLADGMYFACAGSPLRILPVIETPDFLEFRVHVEAPGYQPAEAGLTLTADELRAAEETITVGGEEVTIDVYPGLPGYVEIPLQPHPVSLAGWVTEEDDPDTPIAGAQARISAPEPRGPVATDERGYFRIDDLPVALVVTVEITLDDRRLTRDVTLHPTFPINQRTFSLPA